VIGITAAIAIGETGNDGKWTMAPCKRWFGLCQARWWFPFPWWWLTREPGRPGILWVYAATLAQFKGIGKAEKRAVL